jgi:hypothetical protein
MLTTSPLLPLARLKPGTRREPMSERWRSVRSVAVFVILLSPVPAAATVEMQAEARKAGFVVANCRYCHATPHSAEVMKRKARELNMSDGNCLLCHGSKIPSKLNDRGRWLVSEKTRRGAARAEMAWLKEYKEPPPAEKKP